MKLTLFAATGGIGRHLLEQALAAGHQVTAVVRNPAALPGGATAIRADLAAADPAVLRRAIEGADAVLSGLGARSPKEAGIALKGTQAIVQAMNETAARRLVVVSAAPLSTLPSPGRPAPPRHDPGEGFFMRHVLTPVIKRVLKGVYADLALMEDLLRAGTLDWTIVRPPRLTNGKLTGVYRTAYGQNLRGGSSVPRADVAHLMLKVLAMPESIRHEVGIAT